MTYRLIQLAIWSQRFLFQYGVPTTYNIHKMWTIKVEEPLQLSLDRSHDKGSSSYALTVPPN